MFNLGGQELLIVLVVVVLLFGGKKIPELMRGVGKGLGEFRKGVDDAKTTARRALEEEEKDWEREERERMDRDREKEAVNRS
jgi:sec-independent protein translocase protein TatA